MQFLENCILNGKLLFFLPLANLSPIVKLAQELYRPVVPGVLDFGRSVNPISTRRGRLCSPHYYWHALIIRPTYGPVLMIDGITLKNCQTMILHGNVGQLFFLFFFYKCRANNFFLQFFSMFLSLQL